MGLNLLWNCFETYDLLDLNHANHSEEVFLGGFIELELVIKISKKIKNFKLYKKIF